MDIVVLLALVAAVYIAKNRSKSFIVKSLLLAVLLSMVSILLFELFNGPHPECATNDSVGPCDLPGRLWFDAPFIFVQIVFYWVGIVITHFFARKVRFRKDTTKK